MTPETFNDQTLSRRAMKAELLDADRCIVLNGPVDSSASKATYFFEWDDVTDLLGP